MKFTLKKDQPAGASFQVGGSPQVNLLPRAVIEKREQSKMLVQWAIRIGLALAVLGVAVAGMLSWQALVSLQLKAAQDENLELLAQVAAKSDIQALLNTERSLEDYSSEAMVTDLEWQQEVAALVTKLPKGSYLCGFALTTGSAPADAPQEHAGLFGTVDVCGPFPSSEGFLRDMSRVDGVLQADAVAIAQDSASETFRHTIAVEIDQTAYSSVAAQLEAQQADSANQTGDAEETAE